MEDLFSDLAPKANNKTFIPLPERMRAMSIDDIFGQQHLVGQDGPIRLFLESGDIPSMLLWGPPGVGKTTIALLIARSAGYELTKLLSMESGIKEIRQVIAAAQISKRAGRKTLLFIDEIHKYNKTQQDALLNAVEMGVVTLIGATTENPSFEVNAALLSRCQIYTLKHLEESDLIDLINNALEKDEVLSQYDIKIDDPGFLLTIAGGDARKALNALELAFMMLKSKPGTIKITRGILERALQQKTARYDKKGENHYDIISAFIKSLRGSDPDAAMYWLAMMLDAGEDPKFIARRMVIFASEDIGNANPFALTLAMSVFQSVQVIGMPECRINLAQGVTYMASCPKSNSSYMAIDKAMADVRRARTAAVPLHMRNAPTKFMKQQGYGDGYKYPHDYDGHFVDENYFPEGMKPKAYYVPGDFGKEREFKAALNAKWPDRYRKK